MSVVTLSITDSQLCQAVGNFLTAIVPAGTQIVQGQDNEVPLPKTANWIELTPILSTRIATNIDTWAATGNPATKQIETFMRSDVQVDCYGPQSHDLAQIIVSTFRDEWAVGQFAASGIDITPLYTSEPRNLQFINDQDQYEKRWSLDLSLQVNPVVSVPLQTADIVSLNELIDVNQQYHP